MVKALVAERRILALHDISDGGRVAAALEMAFAGNCGVEVDLPTSQYRVATARVKDLMETPVPGDRTALPAVLGILRYECLIYVHHKNLLAHQGRHLWMVS